ncbi:MAG TPA: hypothetical protein DCW29_23440 [Janthinobacterium sp.]|nr:hypothetical protein [Janthinobacterium sp.]
MEISYDPIKNSRHIAQRGLSFDRAADFDFNTAVFRKGERKPYPESRYVAIGYLDDRLHVLCFAETESGMRAISFRKANHREG